MKNINLRDFKLLTVVRPIDIAKHVTKFTQSPRFLFLLINELTLELKLRMRV